MGYLVTFYSDASPISGHFSGVRCIDGLGGILITPNCPVSAKSGQRTVLLLTTRLIFKATPNTYHPTIHFPLDTLEGIVNLTLIWQTGQHENANTQLSGLSA